MEVKRRKLNYRNTLHLTTGKAPAKLMFRRSVSMRIPRKSSVLKETYMEEAKKADKEWRLKRKKAVDERKKTGDRSVKVGDKFIIKQNKSTVKPISNTAPYKVVSVLENIAFI